MEGPEPLDPNFRLTLGAFEGPLDLLLFLVQKHELDIRDLPIAFVTERYLEYVTLMGNLNLDVAAEYLVMAATLAHIKSKMLLPTPPVGQDDAGLPVEEIDPRADLIRKLLEYQKYKTAAGDLASRGVAGRDVFLRGLPAPEAEGPAPLADVGIFKLLDAFKAVLARTDAKASFSVDVERVGIQDRMTALIDLLKERRSCEFDALFEGIRTTYDVVVTFLAILEMTKMRLLRVYQADPQSALHIEYRVLDADAPPDGAQDAPEEQGAPRDGQETAHE